MTSAPRSASSIPPKGQGRGQIVVRGGSRHVLQLDHRVAGILGDQSVAITNEVNGEVGFGEIFPDHVGEFAGCKWERLFGQDAVARLEQFALQLIALMLQVGCRLGKVDRPAVRRGRLRFPG